MSGSAQTRYEVAIVGAGIAGLSAAKSLCESGVSVILIEARDRCGGRVHTIHRAGMPIELGAEFIHGTPEEFLRFAERSRLTHIRGGDAHAYGVVRSETRELVPLPHFWEDLSLFMKSAREIAGRDRPFSDALKSAGRNPELRRFIPFVRSYVEGFHAADPDELSLHTITAEESELDEKLDRGIARFSHGFGSLIDALESSVRHAGACLRLNSVVDQVRWARRSAELSLHSRAGMRLEKFRAERLLVTLPLSLLQYSIHQKFVEGSVRFEPALEQKKRAVDLLKMGPVSKINLRFRHRFWETAPTDACLFHQNLKNLSFLHHAPMPGLFFPTWWTQSPVAAPVLTGWAGGPQATWLGNPLEEGWVGAAVHSFSEISGIRRSVIEDELEGWDFHDWQSDPYSRGAYSYVGVGGAGARADLGKPVNDTIYFAGEALNVDGQSGTVHGAMTSGAAAAREILKSVKSGRSTLAA